MQFAIDDCYLPATVTGAPMTDEEFTAFCSGYPDYFIEMTAEGEIEIMPPNFSLTGSRHAEINWQLKQWARLNRAKMREWIENGCQLAWLIDPERRAVEVYRPGGDAEILTDPVSVAGDGPVEGFLLELKLVWNPLSD